MTTQIEKRQKMDADPENTARPKAGNAAPAAGLVRDDSGHGRFNFRQELLPDVAAAYRVCEEIARREARNFYYAFRALPTAKRDAICAVYAFMRHADDLSDDESRPHHQRRVALEEWLGAWHVADAGFDSERLGEGHRRPNAKELAGKTGAVFLALADARRRFGISSELLDQLVQGTAMDLDRPIPAAAEVSTERPSAPALDLYPTFDELYRYCYLVASVVGLVCIRIFGYQDARAEKLAEETGIAFQLTNILRDVREDAARGRVYIPVEDMDRFGVAPGDFAAIASGNRAGKLSPGEREVLAYEARRAERYYQSGWALLPLLAADSRPAMWVLLKIYHRLLERIVHSNYEVFSAKVRVPTPEKLWILAQGLMRVLFSRLGRAEG